MSTYLLEIGTEELPANHIPEAQRRLTDLFTTELKNELLGFDSIETYATPRRLTVKVSGLPMEQETVEKKVRGPKYDVGFESDGTAKKPAIGFAKKNNVEVTDLEKEVIGDVPYIVCKVTTGGGKTTDILAKFVPGIINQISGERLMRWGNSELKFSRPIRWIVSLLDKEVVEFSLCEIKADRKTYGHRILAPQEISLSEPEDYVESLRKANVLVCQAERKEIILKQVNQLSGESQGVAGRLDTSLLDEVVNITEWPRALKGEFSKDYLELPDALLETIMVHHQRYFPVVKKNADKSSIKNNLLPYFITVSNNDLDSAKDTIVQGNERVLRARLADGRFFYFDDQKKSLESRASDLGELTYQNGLGSYLDKRERLVNLAKELSKKLNLDKTTADHLEKAMLYLKLDLVTNLVGELPELQGYVGSWYAQEEGIEPEVVKAIASHYAPRHTDDEIPADLVGGFASVLDKIDHLTGLFSLGKKPTGSSDPFALRRNAQGLVDILIDGLNEYDINVSELIDSLLDVFEPKLKNRKKGFDRAKVKSELCEFIVQRLRGKLMDMGYGREIVDAVLALGDSVESMAKTKERCAAIESLLANQEGIDLIRAGVRVSNILKKDSCTTVDESAISLEEEKALWELYKKEVQSKVSDGTSLASPNTKEELEELGKLLSKLTTTIDKFFDGVMVNDEDAAKRNLRHGILSTIDCHFKQFGEFKKLQPLLP